MALAVLALTDSAIHFYYNDEVSSHLGVAQLTDSGVVFGDDAWQQAKLKPLKHVDKYWMRLNLEPLLHGNQNMQHFADIAYHQLHEITRDCPSDTPLILIVPDTYNHEQLALLLGIAEQCNLSVKALVNDAVAALHHINKTGEYLYIDVQLHQCVLSHVQVLHGTKLIASEVIAGCGLLSWYQHWAKLLTNEFIRTCRFDPLYSAQNEQQLFNLLPDLLAQAESQINITIDNRSLSVDRATLVNDSAILWQGLKQRLESYAQVNKIFVSENFAKLPLAMSIHQDITRVTFEQIQNNCQQVTTLNHSENNGVSLVTQLEKSSATTKVKNTNKAHLKPTYVVWQGNAFPITNDDFYLHLNSSQELLISRNQHPNLTWMATFGVQDNQLVLKQKQPQFFVDEKRAVASGGAIYSGVEFGFIGQKDKLSFIHVFDSME